MIGQDFLHLSRTTVEQSTPSETISHHSVGFTNTPTEDDSRQEARNTEVLLQKVFGSLSHRSVVVPAVFIQKSQTFQPVDCR